MSPERRLDRLEALADKILEGLQETKYRVDSNAKAIQALTTSLNESKLEWQKDRKGMYQLLGRLTRSMADFYEIQSDFYSRFDQIDERQAKITEILWELKNNREIPDDFQPF